MLVSVKNWNDVFKLEAGQVTRVGKFIDFYLPYSDENGSISSLKQAERILQKGHKLIQMEQKNVAILYSANYGQTRKIQEIYFTNGWKTAISGSNQAAVMHSMESLLENANYS